MKTPLINLPEVRAAREAPFDDMKARVNASKALGLPEGVCPAWTYAGLPWCPPYAKKNSSGEWERKPEACPSWQPQSGVVGLCLQDGKPKSCGGGVCPIALQRLKTP